MTQQSSVPSEIPVFNNQPIMVLVLGFVTCGLYMIYWNMKMAEVLNAFAKREAISTPIAILAGCCQPVSAYYYYLAGESLGMLGREIGREEELKGKSTLLLVLGLIFPAAAAMIVQGHVNEYYAKTGKA